MGSVQTSGIAARIAHAHVQNCGVAGEESHFLDKYTILLQWQLEQKYLQGEGQKRMLDKIYLCPPIGSRVILQPQD